MNARLEAINKLGQSIWCDTISRKLIDSGDLQKLIDDGVVGMTSNPTIFHQAISSGNDYDQKIEALIAEGKNADQVYEELTIADIADAADLLKPVYDRTDGLDGYISLEVNPHLANDTEGTIKEARHLFSRLDRKNVLIKVPATDAGIPVIEALIGGGINVNVTLIFSLEMHKKVMEAYIKGVEAFAASGGDVSKVASVASFFVSRVDALVDKKIQEKIDAGDTSLTPTLGKAAVGNAKMAYELYRSVFHGDRFAAMRSKGACVQRPLWASTSTKNPAYPDTAYVDPLIGPETVNTLPLNTLEAVMDHGATRDDIVNDLQAYKDAIAKIQAAGISMDACTDELLKDGVRKFAESFDALMADIRKKMAAMQTA